MDFRKELRQQFFKCSAKDTVLPLPQIVLLRLEQMVDNIFHHRAVQILRLQINVDVNTRSPFWRLPLQSQTNTGFDSTEEFFGTNFLDKRQARWLDPHTLLSPALSAA